MVRASRLEAGLPGLRTISRRWRRGWSRWPSGSPRRLCGSTLRLSSPRLPPHRRRRPRRSRTGGAIPAPRCTRRTPPVVVPPNRSSRSWAVPQPRARVAPPPPQTRGPSQHHRSDLPRPSFRWGEPARVEMRRLLGAIAIVIRAAFFSKWHDQGFIRRSPQRRHGGRRSGLATFAGSTCPWFRDHGQCRLVAASPPLPAFFAGYSPSTFPALAHLRLRACPLLAGVRRSLRLLFTAVRACWRLRHAHVLSTAWTPRGTFSYLSALTWACVLRHAQTWHAWCCSADRHFLIGSPGRAPRRR